MWRFTVHCLPLFLSISLVMAVCKFCGIPFSSVSTVCDHLELYHDSSQDVCPGRKKQNCSLFLARIRENIQILLDDPWRVNDRAFRSAFARYKFPSNSRIPFSAPASTIAQLLLDNESAACLSNGASCLRVRVSLPKRKRKVS